MRRILCIQLWICMVFISWITEPTWAMEPKHLSIRPNTLDIGLFYSGGSITITGEVPDGHDAVIEITGPEVNGTFDIKGRVGPFWMTQDKADVEEAPSLYALLLPGGEEWMEKASSLDLGFENLKQHMAITADTLPSDKLFEMFVNLKKNEGLYMVKENTVSYVRAEDGGIIYMAVYRFPPSTVAGEYTVTATAVKNGTKVMVESRPFHVEEVGFTRLVERLATHRRLTYGILAVLIALFVGSVMGFIFKGGRGH